MTTLADSVSSSFTSMSNMLGRATAAMVAPVQHMPDASLNQIAGVSACNQMQPQLQYVQTHARPRLGAPQTAPYAFPRLALPGITDMRSRTYQIEDAISMPNIQIEVPSQLAGAIGTITAGAGAVMGTIAKVMPTLNMIASVGYTLKGISNAGSLMGKINLLAMSNLGRAADSVFAAGTGMNPIAMAANLAGKAQQVHNSLSLLKSGNLNTASSLYAAANVFNSASSLVPGLGLGAVGQQLQGAATTVSSVSFAVTNATTSVRGAVSNIGNSISNPSLATPATIANSVSMATNAVSSSMSTLGGLMR